MPTARIYEPGTNTLATTWHTPTGWVLVRDALTMGPRQGEDSDHPAHPPAGRRGRRPPPGADRPLPRGKRRDGAGLRARVRLRRAPRPSGRWSARTVMPPTPAAPGQTIRLQTDMGLGHRGQLGAGPAHPAAGRPGLLLAVVGRGPRLAGATSTTPTAGSPRRPGSGATGWRARGWSTTAGASRSSARRWRSRASPTCRPGRPSPRSPPRCPRPRAASATGTTATPGSATRPSPCRRCTSSTSTGRRTSSCSSSPTSSSTRTERSRSCTGSTGAAT